MTAESHELVKHDDGTCTVHLVSLNAGLLSVDRLSIIEMYNLLREFDECDDGEAVLLKWAQGYRDPDIYELADRGDDGEQVLAGDTWSCCGD
ncbi:hypothetical protein [Mycobacterium kiyosense]|uniref:hypothetical protein n=1 Tax=Mycobacterium kiyosense TaxID=2871094 RepID=UPI001F405E00|nr:hypothetical protein [Mycobacterium kiyosense]BDB41237.1 hypothetical protein IWGMT90018_16830 [Mycobacterium kiyosense]GLB94609.1 hypothetical protein SRL2020226_13850 [Mycobacterium kiyosense]GLD08550.1 hypothetical protein Mkiyose1383_48760 [Mycobacterium kiyosense]GLD13723.1 hypothetical protein Mkiyose1384_39470 [Mycobacterium kiyosense]GLD19667.1 hypothetical protein Mkiyose1385_37660 [Mycobacterium kiyosense]